MSDKKHIDRLFQEGFKDFEATPSDAVWKNIEANLKGEKKKRRVIPIWWRYAGVAALLLLLLTFGGVFNNTNKNATNQVVDTEKTSFEKTNTENNNPLNDATNLNTIASDNTQDNSDESKETLNSHSELIKNKINSPKETSIAETAASKNENKTKVTSSNNLNIKKNKVYPSYKNNKAIANNASAEKNNIKNLQNQLQGKNTIANTFENGDIETINDKTLVNKEEAKSHIKKASKHNTAIANMSDKKIKGVVKFEEKAKENKRSIEDALNNTEAVLETNNKLNKRWSVAPNVAPVYFNTLGNGSSIDPQFNTNSTSGDINMSYGISTSYAINKKISVRSGVHSVNLGYNTDDVVVFRSVGINTSSSALRNIDGASNNVSLISSETLNAEALSSIASSNAEINQNLRYIEVPLEIQYTLSDKKFGVNLIGGFSSFFLNTSKVFYEEDNGNRTILGEAKNINNLSYSANFGLGLNYKISDKFNFNLEPIFKYQFNTFSDTSGNFSPYFIGVYTGFAIKF